MHIIAEYQWTSGHALNYSRYFAPQHDLREVATAQEAFYVDNERYTDLVDEIIGPIYGFYPSEGVVIQVIFADKTYEMVAFHKEGDAAFLCKGPPSQIERISKAEALSIVKEANK